MTRETKGDKMSYTIATTAQHNKAQRQYFTATLPVKRSAIRFANTLHRSGAFTKVEVSDDEGTTLLKLG